MLKVKLFGPGQAQYGDEILPGFPKHQCFHLFCYLLLNRRRPHSRERLAAVFWGDHSTATSRTYLRNAVWRLRQALQSAHILPEEIISIAEDSICLLWSDAWWLDVEAFETAVGQCLDVPGDELSPEQAAGLDQAAALYTGDLLEGIYDDWCLHDRERLRLLYLDALTKLLAFHEIHGTYEHGLVYGERLLAQDPTREKTHRQMMRLHWLGGNQHEALGQYKRCSQILREELGVAPMEATRLLYEQMLHNRFPRQGRHPNLEDLAPDVAGGDSPAQTFSGRVLLKLQRLRALTEEANAELQDIERLIHRGLPNS